MRDVLALFNMTGYPIS